MTENLKSDIDEGTINFKFEDESETADQSVPETVTVFKKPKELSYEKRLQQISKKNKFKQFPIKT